MKQTLLNSLKLQTGLKTKELAEKLGVKVQTLNYQLVKDETIDETLKYMKQLGIKELTGTENGVNITINLK
jgi:plasmid maintenance system antidote protein VapI